MQISELYADFGQLVRKFRLQSKLTQDELGERVGLSRTSITNIELGRQKVLLHYLFLIAETLRVDVNLLLPTLPDPDSIVAIERKLPKGLPLDEKELIRSVVRSHNTSRR